MKDINSKIILGLSFIISLLFVACTNSKNLNAQTSSDKIAPLDAKTLPPLPSPQKIEDGIIAYKIKLDKADEASNVWIYLPEKPVDKKLPVVLITAAGSYLWNGTGLDQGDQPEHLPYVRKGYAVIAYETPGSLDGVDMQRVEDARLLKAAKDFKYSKAGLNNEQNALNYALDKIPVLDVERIYIAGHSSAATHALLVAANESRIKAAIAYAPATDLEKSLADILEPFDKHIFGFKNFIKESSPNNNISKIKIPVFIFQAKDDSVVPIENTKTFVSELEKVNSNVTFVIAENGNHYDSMIQQGIPKGIEWLNKIAFAEKNTK